MKVTFAKVFLQDNNILILDEPTNFLDMPTIEAIEDAMKEYTGTVLVISHDRRFLKSVATRVLHIEDKVISTFETVATHSRDFSRELVATYVGQKTI